MCVRACKRANSMDIYKGHRNMMHVMQCRPVITGHFSLSVLFSTVLCSLITHRNYQLEGLNWMIRLIENGINGILADEMVSFLPMIRSHVLLRCGSFAANVTHANVTITLPNRAWERRFRVSLSWPTATSS